MFPSHMPPSLRHRGVVVDPYTYLWFPSSVTVLLNLVGSKSVDHCNLKKYKNYFFNENECEVVCFLLQNNY